MNFILALILLSNTILAGPLSKIIITSQTAKFLKKENHIVLKYCDDVKTTLNDGSTITAKNLELIINHKSRLDKSKLSKPGLDKFVFKGNVVVSSSNRKISADIAEGYLDEKQFKLYDNVVVEQFKENKDEIPIITKSDFATIDLNSYEVSFWGKNSNPVSTVVNMDGHSLSGKLTNKKSCIKK